MSLKFNPLILSIILALLATGGASANPNLPLAKKFLKAAQYDSALIYLQRAADDYAQAGRTDSLLACYAQISQAAQKAGQDSLALVMLEQAVTVSTSRLGSLHAMSGEAQLNLANFHKRAGRFEAAIPYYRGALTIYRHTDGDSAEFVGSLHFYLAQAQRGAKQYEAAIAEYDTAAAIYRREYGPDDSSVGILYAQIAMTQQQRGDHPQALAFFNKAIPILRTATDADSTDLLDALELAGDSYIALNQSKAAAESYAEAFPKRRAASGDTTIAVMDLANKIANLYLAGQDTLKAIEFWELTVQLVQGRFGLRNYSLAAVCQNLGYLYRGNGNFAQAIERFRLAQAIYEAQSSPDLLKIAECYRQIGAIFFDDTAQRDSAAVNFIAEIEYAEQGGQDTTAAITDAYVNAGATLRLSGAPERAGPYLQHALALRQILFGPDSEFTGYAAYQLGQALSQAGQDSAALISLQLAVNIYTKQKEDSRIRAVWSCETMAQIYERAQRFDRAVSAYRQALTIVQPLRENYRELTGNLYLGLGKAYHRQSQPDSALAALEQALELRLLLYHPEDLKVDAVYDAIQALHDDFQGLQKLESRLIEKKGKDHPHIADLYRRMGKFCEEKGRLAQAMDYANRRLEILTALPETRSTDLADAYRDLGWALRNEHHIEALAAYQKAIAIWLKTEGDSSYSVAAAYDQIGFIYNTIDDNARALEYFTKALNMYRAKYGENSLDVAMTYSHLAMVQGFYAAHYDSAIALFNKALAIKKTLFGEDDPEIATSLLDMAFTLAQQGATQPAIEFYKQALAIRQKKLGEHADVAFIYAFLGAAYEQVENNADALACYQKALAMRQKVFGDTHPQVANSLRDLAGLYRYNGDYELALDYARRALAMRLQTVGATNPSIVHDYNYLGDIYYEKAEYEKALQTYRQSLAVNRELYGEVHTGIAFDYQNMADVYLRAGDYERSLEFYQKALAIDQQIHGEDHPRLAPDFAHVADIYYLREDYDRALEYYQRAQALREKTYDRLHPDIAESYENLCMVYRKQKKYPEALLYGHKMLALRLEAMGENNLQTAETYNTLGLLYETQAIYDTALVYHHKALAIRRSVGGDKNRDTSGSWHNIGLLHHNRGENKQALRYFQQALISLTPGFNDTSIYANPTLEQMALEKRFLTALKGKVNAFRGLLLYPSASKPLGSPVDSVGKLVDLTSLTEKDPKGSGSLEDFKALLSLYQMILEFMEHLRNWFKAEESKLFLGESSHHLYGDAIQVALRLADRSGDPAYKEVAFDILEQSRAAVLLSALNESQALHFAGIPDSLLARERQLKIDLTFYQNQLAGDEANVASHKEKGLKSEAGDAHQTVWREKIFQIKREYEALIDSLEADYPDYYKLTRGQRGITLAEAQRRLPDSQTVVLEFFAADSAIFVAVLTKADFDLIEMPRPLSFDLDIERMRQAMLKHDYNRYVKYARLLYETLFAPVKDRIAGRPLIIIPDGRLSYIPFEALLTADPPADGFADYRRLPFLLREHTVSYAYALSLLRTSGGRADNAARVLMENPSPDAKNLLAYAPVFADTDVTLEDGGLMAAVTRSQRPFVRAGAADRSIITPIPATESEVRRIQTIFVQHGGQAITRLFGMATEASLKAEEFHTYPYLHFATHGFVDEDNPALSGLLLAADTTSAEDGILYAGEIYNLGLKADLVTLSACETGLGKLAAGEGVIGLTRAFLYAGAANLIVSLWQVADESTSELMIHFYGNLLTGQTKSAALQAAKNKLLESAQYADPYYWSPFVLIGR